VGKPNTAVRVIEKIEDVVNFIILAAFMLLFLFGSYVYLDGIREVKQADAAQYAQYKPSTAGSKSFEQLREINPEVFGWLTLSDTKVDYPVAQGENNTKYVNTDASGEYSLSGSIFLDSRNDTDMTDPVSIIYGHHMEEEEMFGCFDRFEDPDFFKRHRTGYLYYNGQNHRLTTFAFLRADGYDSGVYDPSVTSAELEDYVDRLLDRAVVKYDPKLEDDSRIVLLSTCETGATNGRMILMCTVGPGEMVIEDGEAVTESRHRLWWILAAVLAVLALTVLLILGRKKKRQQGGEKNMKAEKTERQVPAPERGGATTASALLSLLIRLAVIFAVFFVLIKFVFGVISASGNSMAPAFRDNDIAVFYRLDKNYSAGDLVVYETPDGDLAVSRVVAVDGDTVEITKEGLSINGYVQQEDYADGETLAFEDGPDYPLQLSGDEVFVICDNREYGEDSRLFGPVEIDDTRGRVITVIRHSDL